MRRTTRFALICHLLGLLLILFGLTLLVPLAISLIDRDGAGPALALGFLITTACGGALWVPSRGARTELRTRDGFVIATLFWVVLGIFGALPLLLVAEPQLDLSNAVFESVSGLTTTGATVIEALDALPRSVLYYRQQLQWLGGFGTIVIAVAILPLLGVGGAQLFKSETAGPMKDQKLTPRIAETARGLWTVYFTIAAACFLAYRWAGMSWTDAFMHMCSTMGLGGFAAYDASFAAFDSPLIEFVLVAFALLSSLGVSAFLGPRVLATMLGWFGKASSEEGAPAVVTPRLVWLQAGLSITMVLTGSFVQILTVMGFLLGLFPILCVLGLYRRSCDLEGRPLMLVRYVFAPLFVGVSTVVLVLGAVQSPHEVGIALALVGLFFLARVGMRRFA